MNTCNLFLRKVCKISDVTLQSIVWWEVCADIVVTKILFFYPEFGGDLDVSGITNFIDNGGNVLVAVDSTVGM